MSEQKMETKPKTDSEFLTLEQLAERWTVTERSIQTFRKDPDFPPAMRLGRRTLRWRRADIEEFESRRISGE